MAAAAVFVTVAAVCNMPTPLIAFFFGGGIRHER